MPDLKVTTDMGDWSTLPRRIRLAFLAVIVGASVVGIAAGIGLLSITVAAILLAAMGIVWVLVFDRRRPWWPDEPTVAVDPVAANLGRKVAVFAAIGIAAAVLGLTGVLPL
jgi:hypothetical protein